MKLRRLLLLCLWILSLITISFYGGTISYGFFFAITLLPVVSLVNIVFVHLRFRIYQKVESRNMVCGQPMPYFFVLQNDDYFAFSSIRVNFFSSFSDVEKMPENPEYELLPGDKFTYETRVICKYRGEYEVGVKEVIITDFLHLFYVRYRIPGTIKALVLPKVIELPEINSIRELNTFLQRESLNMDTEPDSVVRDYIPGDALKQIHWKSTAKNQKLKVRTRIGEEKQGIAIFCDTKRYSQDMRKYLPLENKILEVVLTLGFFMAKREISFSTYYGQNSPAETNVIGLKDFEGFYKKTSELMFRQEEDFGRTLIQAVSQGRIFKNKLIFCVMHELNGEIMRITDELSRSGHLVILYVITDKNLEDAIRQGNERRKIIVIPPESELEGRL